jgi:hypothetical protein
MLPSPCESDGVARKNDRLASPCPAGPRRYSQVVGNGVSRSELQSKLSEREAMSNRSSLSGLDSCAPDMKFSVATATSFETFVTDRGLSFSPVRAGYYELLDSPEAQAALKNPLKMRHRSYRLRRCDHR